MGTERLTMAQAIVRYLAGQYSESDGGTRRLIPRLLGVFGHGNVAGLGQALDEHRALLPYVQGRNEQSLVHIAAAYARATRRRATLAVTSSIGPGATNMVTGAALATIDRLPVLLLPADTYASRRQGPVLQQLEHPLAGDVSVNDCFRPVARYFDRLTRPEQLLTALPEAMRVLTSPVEAGAVVLALPQDVQSEAADYPLGFFETRVWPILRPEPQPGQVAAVAAMLAQARRPLCIAGGGVRYAEAEAALESFAAEFGIPVAETFAGKGAVQVPGWWGVGGLGLEGTPAANAIAAEADCVLAVGTRLTDFVTASQSLFQDPHVRFAAINVSDRDARKQGAIPIVADARKALAALAGAARSAGLRPDPEWRERVTRATEAWRLRLADALAADGSGALTQGQLIGVLQEQARAGDTLIAAAGGPPGDLLKIWDATGGRHCHLEFGYSCMGYELPAALGVRMAQPEGEVVALIGDGSFLMQPSELATAAQEGLGVTVVIAENHGFQVIDRLQRLTTGRRFGNEFRRRTGPDGSGVLDGDYLRLDLAAVAAGLGATVQRAATVAEVRAALAAARGQPGPRVVVVEIAPHADLPSAEAWWDVAPAAVSGLAEVRARRREYERGRQRQRWHG
ncbi:MAG TPA: 3D-(3,5/4)-trihydroxycyclohexane-1,2-dione acylhydrolase (decyclizing) [Candidatus Micrarchaeia archaeon]|nr:3D-(3,5/4)-trihydroxycyclohexane-1,2-dione acylhydrolase (decyclizing) [Candidatus Micrarchaeia archaeon]